MDITEFIAARLAEDEEAAQDTARGNPGPWSLDHAWIRDATGEVVVCDEYRWGGSAFTHIARHDPARALREVAAKRAILADHERIPGDGVNFTIAEQNRASDVLLYLAAVYSDHPDYRAEWKP